MSHQASTWVIENSQHKGAAFLVLLMIANHAHADGTNAFPSVKTLAKECRMSERQIGRIIRKLQESGELLIDQSGGRSSNRYAIAMKQLTPNPDKMTGLRKTNPVKSDRATLTNPTGNPDKSGRPYKEENHENRHENPRAMSDRPAVRPLLAAIAVLTKTDLDRCSVTRLQACGWVVEFLESKLPHSTDEERVARLVEFGNWFQCRGMPNPVPSPNQIVDDWPKFEERGKNVSKQFKSSPSEQAPQRFRAKTQIGKRPNET